MKFNTVDKTPRTPFSEYFQLIKAHSKKLFLVAFNFLGKGNLIETMLQVVQTLLYALIAILYLDEAVRVNVLRNMFNQRKS